ncbi:MAG: GIY-YIG nuclease family protein [Coriobacteriales bacterium]|jgi:hypothetical protein|nr:GIY-YIG nuclease family protein [Coriobacteriales bacterium]
MPGAYKIGMTDKDDLTIRMKELHTTGAPLPFACVYACIVKDNAETEKAVHSKFAKQWVNPRREFFKTKALRIVKAIKPFEVADITPNFREDFDSLLTEKEKNARRKTSRELEKIDPTVAEAKNLYSSVKSSAQRQTS